MIALNGSQVAERYELLLQLLQIFGTMPPWRVSRLMMTWDNAIGSEGWTTSKVGVITECSSVYSSYFS
jgi:hypothetical protein